MRRAVLTLGGTAAGIAALLAVKFHPAAATAPAASSTAPVTAGSASPATTGPVTVRPAGSGTPAAARPKATPTAKTFTGAVDNTQYGPMQVQITVAGRKVTKVTVLQQTNTGGTSQQIDAMAIPKLTSEALAAQSAKIDAVSGASYTSAGYKQSLQSALDQAGL